MTLKSEPVAIVGALETLLLAVWALVVILADIETEVAAAVVAIIAAAVPFVTIWLRGRVTPV